jgi:UDP-glucose 4-epimerase
MGVMAVLVTGGAGYIGSHTVLALREAGRRVVVLDDLSTGWRRLVPEDVPLVVGDIADQALVAQILSQYRVEGVMHFAGRSQVPESMGNPGLYFEANTVKTLALLRTLAACGIRWMVFSSSASVYGEPRYLPIDEEHPVNPDSPYGLSKVHIEEMLPWFERAHGIRWMALRYFNAAGADPAGRAGEMHQPETHIIPILLGIARQKAGSFPVYGTDYPTGNGTCVRDFVHVSDLATAHVLAMEALVSGSESGIFNLGSGKGFSVREIIESAREITRHPIPTQNGPRRPGDPSILVASPEKARRQLGWRPGLSGIEQIIGTAWDWQQKNPARGSASSIPRA